MRESKYTEYDCIRMFMDELFWTVLFPDSSAQMFINYSIGACVGLIQNRIGETQRDSDGGVIPSECEARTKLNQLPVCDLA